MSFLTGKHLSRRALLRGSGAAIALPFLDAMCPAFGAASKPARRLAVIYVPNGIIMNQWTPAEVGADFQFTRILKPLEPYRADVTLISGLQNKSADKAQGGGHAKASGSFLSSAQPSTRRARTYTRGPRSIRSRPDGGQRRRACRRCNWAARIRAWWATAIRVRAVPTRIQFRG